MGGPRPRVVFVGHDASRTGAPIAGLAFVRWLARQGTAEVGVALLGPGPLEGEYRRAAPTTVRAPRSWVVDALAQRVPGARARRPRPPGADPQVVVANTLAALGPAAALGAPRLVCWVHELDGVAERVLPARTRRHLAPQVHRWIAAGPRVADMLVARWGLPPARVVTVPEFTDHLPAPDAGGPHRDVRILGAGAGAPRKGVDAFVACLSDLSTRGPVPRAAWVGGRPEALAVREAAADLARVGIGDRVQLVAEVDDLEPWWPRRGLLLHPAREDPYPLVVLEAGQRSVPVVTWDTGGAADLLRDAGLGHLVAEPGDLIGLVRRVEGLLADEEGRADAGRALQRATRALVADEQAPQIWAACVEPGP